MSLTDFQGVFWKCHLVAAAYHEGSWGVPQKIPETHKTEQVKERIPPGFDQHILAQAFHFTLRMEKKRDKHHTVK